MVHHPAKGGETLLQSAEGSAAFGSCALVVTQSALMWDFFPAAHPELPGCGRGKGRWTEWSKNERFAEMIK